MRDTQFVHKKTIRKSIFYLASKFIVLFILTIPNLYAQISMKIPDNLKKGDTIALVATARKNTEDNLKPTLNLIKSWGLNAVIGSSIGLSDNQLAGTDEQRAADIQEQLDNPNIKAIWCVRGGYGTVRIIDLLNFTKFKEHPKWIIGFSDVTVLHSYINKLRIASLHAIMPVTIPNASPEAVASLKKSLFGENLNYEIARNAKNRLGNAEGELIGGNLSILYSLMGSNAQLDCKGKILFIEDLDEYLYHIDRMMMSLDRCGCFENLNGLIVGGMTKMKDNEIPWGKNANEIIENRTKKYSFPVIYDFPAGHIKDNRSLIFGKKVTLEVNQEKSILSFL